MSAARRISWGRVAAIALALAAFAAALHVAHRQRLAVEPLQDSATRLHRVSILPRAYAQTHEGLWPALDARTRAFALPLNDLPQGYTIAPRFSANTLDPIPAMLLGPINNAAAYTLNPVDSVASDYIYFGFAVANEQEFQALVKAVRGGAPLDGNVAVEAGHGTLGSSTLYRLHAKIAETLATEGVTQQVDPTVRSRFPVLMERPRDGYAWVQYLDSGMERLPYPGPFPVCAAVLEAAGNGNPG
jgi:hypothetical protein